MFDIVARGDIQAFRAEIEKIRNRSLADVINILQARNGSGKTLLHVAAEHNQLAMVEELLSMDIEVATRDSSGKTAAELAEAAGHAAVAALLRTRGAWQDEAKALGIGFNRAIHLLEESFVHVEHARGKNLVMFMGSTGVGKSTLLNYLLGCRYDLEGVGLDKVLRLRAGSKPEYAQVGHNNAVSMTLFPQTFPVNGESYLYCDLAGFDDTRTGEEALCASNNAQVLTRLSSGVKGIVLLLDKAGFKSARGKDFKNVLKTLASMMPQDPQMAQKFLESSVFFMLTKMPIGTTREQVMMRFINPLHKVFQDELDAGMPLSEEDAKIYIILELMRAHPEKILVPNIFDNGQSVSLINGALRGAEVQDRDSFDFTSTASKQRKFNELLMKISKAFVAKKALFETTLPDEIRQKSADLARVQTELQRLRSEITDREDEMKKKYDRTDDDRVIAANRTEIGKKRVERTKVNDILQQLYRDLATERGKKALAERKEPCKIHPILDYRANSETRYRRVHKQIRCVFKITYRSHDEPYTVITNPTHEFVYQGESFTHADLWCNAGYFGNPAENKDGGSYRVTYNCGGNGAAQATVTIWTTTDLLQENKQKKREAEDKIGKLEADIAIKEKELKAIDDRISDLEREVNDRERAITQAEADVSVRNARLQSEIDARRRLIVDQEGIERLLLTNIESLNKKLVGTDWELKVNHNLFVIVYKIVKALELHNQSDVLREFMQQFEVYARQHGIDLNIGAQSGSTDGAAASAAAPVAPSPSASTTTSYTTHGLFGGGHSQTGRVRSDERTAQVLRDEAYARALARGLDETEAQELADRAMFGHSQGGH